jgi:succinoglycan biosynthesis protein ExoM
MNHMRVQICVLTFQRPEMLRSALESLRRQESQHCQATMQVLVIDNDAKESGKPVFKEVFGASHVAARYVVERQRGIARARNRALEESSDADFIAFLDDDEVADNHWLDRLLEVQAAYDADVVTGPSFPDFVKSTEWIVRGGFFAPRISKTGQNVEFVETNNVLMRNTFARRFRFDLRFDSTGGEDTYFFMQLKKAGARMVWAEDATVCETIPEQRTSFSWLMRRSFSEANRYTWCCIRSAPGLVTFASRLAVACAGCCVGVLLLPAGVSGKHRAVRGLRLMSRAVGTVHALAGFTDPYYISPSPSPPIGTGKVLSQVRRT